MIVSTGKLQYIPEVILVEATMTLLIVWVIHYVMARRETFTLRNIAVSSLILTMMAGMFNAMTYYVLYPSGFLNTIIAVNIAMLEMTVLIVVILMLGESIRGISPVSSISMAFLFILSEASMGIFLFFIANPAAGGNLAGAWNSFGLAVNNYLLIIPMVLEMAYIISILRPAGAQRMIFVSLLIMSAINPLASGEIGYAGIGLIVNFSVMTLIMIATAFSLLGGNRFVRKTDHFRLLGMFVLFDLLSAGMLYAVFQGPGEASGWILFGMVSMAMMIYFYFLGLIYQGKHDDLKTAVTPKLLLAYAATIFISSMLSLFSIALYFAPGYI